MKREDTEGNLTFLPVNINTFIDRMVVDRSIDEIPPYGLFNLTFNNRRKQNRQGLTTCSCQGTLYESGRVHLDTLAIQPNSYDTLTEMQEYLRRYGSYHIQWSRGEY